MSLIRGTCRYLRFTISTLDESSSDEIENAIGVRRFLPLTPEFSESAGWAPLHAPLDDGALLTRADWSFGHLVCLTYREDKWAIPKALIQREVSERIEAMLESGELAADTKAARKAMAASIEIEMRRRAFPRTRLVEVAIDTRARTLRIFASGPLAHERVLGLVQRTFGIDVESVAYVAAIDEGSKRIALGGDHLTHLHLSLLDEGYELDLGGREPARFTIGRRIRVRPLDGDAGATAVITGPGLDDNREVIAAVSRGAKIDTIALEVLREDRAYAMTLSADGMLSGVRLPDLYDDDDAVDAPRKAKPVMDFDALVDMRVQLLDVVDDTADALFARYLALRSSSTTWPGEVAMMQRALAGA